jgi:TetR/AcrR family transcriptional regulator, transcriptional repressor for nem operon
MARSQEDKAASHDRIVKIAARRMRESGTAAPGVAEIMQAAGLTHGGFYKHFGSREDLVAEAVERAFSDNSRASARFETLEEYADWYLSPAHRDRPATGCGVAAFSADAARDGERVRAAYAAQVERYLGRLEAWTGSRDTALQALALLTGGLQTARALGAGPLSDQVLAGARDAVKALGA